MAALLCLFAAHMAMGQVKVGDKWFDNGLTFKIFNDEVRTAGSMQVCIADTSENCISNLQSGFEIHFYDVENQEVWAGKTAGRSEVLKLPKPLPAATYVVLRAFKPHVLNKITGSLIHQDKPIEVKYNLE